MTIDLTECRAKIERAQEHREVLDAEVAPGNKSKQFNVSAKLDPQLGYHAICVSEIPEAWVIRLGVILGDVIHNSRGALDYLFWALSCAHLGVAKTERMHKQVQFPIDDDPATFIKKREPFCKIPDAQWTVIDEAQPYDRWNRRTNSLAALRELSNRDKHRALNPLLLRTSTFSLVPPLLNARPYKFHNIGLFSPRQGLEVGTKILDVDFPSDVDPEVEVAGHTTARIELPEGGFEIITGVDLIIATVRSVVDDIEAAF